MPRSIRPWALSSSPDGAVQQPDDAPPLDFIRRYNTFNTALRPANEQIDEKTRSWERVIEKYSYKNTDDFDLVILDGADAGYFDEARLRAAAETIQAQRRQASPAFSKVWQDLYHGSLSTEDDEFLDAMHRTAISNAKVIHPHNINAAVRVSSGLRTRQPSRRRNCQLH